MHPRATTSSVASPSMPLAGERLRSLCVGAVQLQVCVPGPALPGASPEEGREKEEKRPWLSQGDTCLDGTSQGQALGVPPALRQLRGLCVWNSPISALESQPSLRVERRGQSRGRPATLESGCGLGGGRAGGGPNKARGVPPTVTQHSTSPKGKAASEAGTGRHSTWGMTTRPSLGAGDPLRPTPTLDFWVRGHCCQG